MFVTGAGFPFVKLLRLVALVGFLSCGGLSIAPSLAAPNFNGRIMVDAVEYPWSALGRVNAGGKGFCTGALISDRHVLTKASCLYNPVEGRWWHPSELHFIAGYQRDNYQMHSAIARYHIAPGYGTGETLANLIDDWAVITLEEPIGHQAGWIGLQWLDRSTLADLERGTAYVLTAGYRPGQDHAVTVTLDCGIDSLLRRELIERGACRTLLAGIGGLTKLLFIDGGFHVLAPQQMSRAFARSVLNGQAMSAAHAPAAGNPTGRPPRDTMHGLLQKLGYTNGVNGHGEPPDLRVAIVAYEKERRLSVTGEPPRQNHVLAHLASFRTADAARREWARLKSHYPVQLADLDLRIARVELGSQGVFYRVLTDPIEKGFSARRLCVSLQTTGQYCSFVGSEDVPQKSVSDHVIAVRYEKSEAEPGISTQNNLLEPSFSALEPPRQNHVLVHLASFRTANAARREWARLKSRYPAQLADLDLRIARVELGTQGIFYRVLTDLAQDRSSASRLCDSLRTVNQFCSVVKSEAASVL